MSSAATTISGYFHFRDHRLSSGDIICNWINKSDLYAERACAPFHRPFHAKNNAASRKNSVANIDRFGQYCAQFLSHENEKSVFEKDMRYKFGKISNCFYKVSTFRLF